MEPIQLKKLFRTYQGFIIAIAILLVSVVGFFVGIIPLAQRSLGLSDEIQSVTAEVSSLEHKASVLDSLDEETLKNDLITLASAVPSDKSLMTLLGTVDGVTGRTGVSLVDISLAKPGSLATDSAKKLTVQEAAVGSNVLPFILTVRGTYSQISTFLSAIVSVRRFLRVRSLDVSIVAGDVTARVTMDSYYYPFPKSVGSVNQDIASLSDKEEQTIKNVASMELASGESLPTDLAPTAFTGPVGKSDPFSK